MARIGLALALCGCATGEEASSGFGSTLPTTPTSPGASTTTGPEATGTTAEPTTGEPDTTTGDTTTAISDGTSSGGLEPTTGSGTTGPSSGCGDGKPDPFEVCDDGNMIDEDECLNSCEAAACGDGVVQTGVEICDDGNLDDTDACLGTCVAATCGDGVVHAGVEICDDAAMNGTYNFCAVDCSKPGPTCGDGVIDAVGGETCDDGNKIDGDGCSAVCQADCGNQGGGSLIAENGTGMNKMYCYDPADSVDIRARKACESHFGVGACCVITGGYQDLQWGMCEGGGGAGSVHFHPDAHPANHCAPVYAIGDVIAPGFCGTVLGNFLD